MKNNFKRSFYHLLILLALPLFLGSYSIGDAKRFQIETGSRLFLNGTSNVNTFTCDCNEQFAGIPLETVRKGGKLSFRNLDLNLSTGKFDCHNRKIDRDMQKALKAYYYPHIKISLLDSWQRPECLDGECKDWFDVQANVNITITNVTRKQAISAQAKLLSPNRIQMKGQCALQMSSFGVDPPEALMGMIKVNDWITFHFDLIIRIDELN